MSKSVIGEKYDDEVREEFAVTINEEGKFDVEITRVARKSVTGTLGTFDTYEEARDAMFNKFFDDFNRPSENAINYGGRSPLENVWDYTEDGRKAKASTSMVEGRGGQVVISGENFTPPITLTIYVTLQIIDVDSSVITATVPTTLAAGVYTVTVCDSMGRGISSTVLFTVTEPPPPPPTRTPYPAPKLNFGGVICCSVTLRWQWDRDLREDEWFAVRIGKLPDIPHSRTWTKERQYIYTLLSESGDYVWEVAICRGDPSKEHCSKIDGTELTVSDRQTFSFVYDPNCCTPP